MLKKYKDGYKIQATRDTDPRKLVRIFFKAKRVYILI